MIGEQIENYTILQLLGEGGMAKVYLAENKETGQKIALKFLNLEFVRNSNVRNRFLAEAKNMLRLNHNNIIKVGQLFDMGDIVAFEMEYIEGETLKEFIDKKGPLQNEELTKIMIQTLDALEYVHQSRLVHRDVKPSNFMIDKNGTVKLLDFGIAKNMDEHSRDHTATGTHQQMGTLLYMSPEQVRSTKGVTLISDIYSLGVVLWQMACGKAPYDSTKSGQYEILTKIVNESLPILNSKWDYVIQKATQKEETARYQNCQAFKDAILNKTLPIEETKINQSPFETKINKDPYIQHATKKNESSTTRNIFIWSSVAIFLIVVGYSLKQMGSKNKSSETQMVNQFNSNVQVNDVFTVDKEKAYFHNSPQHSTRRNAYLVRGEHGTVQEISDNFVYIVFTNSRNQTSKGWISLEDISF
jgi:serine/threonine protein kinase